MRRDREDEIWLVPSRKGKFDVSSFIRPISVMRIYFPWKSIWRTKAPLKVVFSSGQRC
jgi:hypothetical protein